MTETLTAYRTCPLCEATCGLELTIVDDPAGYYVNLHTEAFPGGAIRGQLAASTPNTALPSTDRSVALLGLLLVALAGADPRDHNVGSAVDTRRAWRHRVAGARARRAS